MTLTGPVTENGQRFAVSWGIKWYVAPEVPRVKSKE